MRYIAISPPRAFSKSLRAYLREVSGSDVHTYSIVVTSLETGKSGVLYEMEVDFTQDPPKKDHHDTFDSGIFSKLLND